MVKDKKGTEETLFDSQKLKDSAPLTIDKQASPQEAATTEKQSFKAELNDAVSLRTFVLLFGVLLIQFAFIASYIGAFHQPTPHNVPVGVVAPEPLRQQFIDNINKIDNHPIQASAVDNEQAGRDALKNEDLTGVYILNPAGTQDKMLVASASGASITEAAEQVMTQAAATQHRTVQFEDTAATQHGDGRGLTSFYLVVGWIVGGYLFAAMLGIAKGAKAINLRRALFRIGALIPYALLSGLGGAWIVDHQLGALTGHYIELSLMGSLLVFCSAIVTMALQSLFGVIGIGITVLIFVVLGNPSAGGPYQANMLPDFWRNIGPYIPNGAGTSAVRSIIYFDGVKVQHQINIILVWTIVALIITVLAATLHRGKDPLDKIDN
ncbi:MAG: ABC transporter permease [Micrococcaceae bacterium]